MTNTATPGTDTINEYSLTPSFSNVLIKPDGSVTFTATIPESQVKVAYNMVLTETVKHTELKGFRKGKAPSERVEKAIGKTRLYTEVLKKLLPEIYRQSVAKLGITPITSPRIETKSLEEGKDWVLSMTTAQKPEFSLGDYRRAVSAALSVSRIWVPGKENGAGTPGQPDANAQSSAKAPTDEKLAKIFDALLAAVKIDLPEFLVEDEVSHNLSHLISQLQKLNLTVDQYLASLGKTSEQLRDEYRTQARDTLKIELILDAIAQDMRITISDEEVDALIMKVGDEKLRQTMNTPSERAGLRSTLRKRKVLDALMRN